MNARMDVVRKIAQRISKKYDLTVPINLNVVLNDVCEYEEVSDIPVEGYTELDFTPPRMKILAGTYGPRKRFTIAHELGHILISWHDGTAAFFGLQNKVSSFYDINELEADEFASELLLPEFWMRKYFETAENKSIGLIISEITKTANVSVKACLYGIKKYWSPENLLYYSLPNDKVMKKCTNKTFTIERFWSKTDEHPFVMYSYCAEESHTDRFNSYQLSHFKFMKEPTEEDILEEYRISDGNFYLFFDSLTNGNPALAVPYIGKIINLLPIQVSAIISLEGYEPVIYHSPNQRSISSSWEDIFEIDKDILSKCLGYSSFEMELHEIGTVYLIFALRDVVLPNVHSPDPNNLLNQLLLDAYYEKDTRLKARRTINGIIGGSNNRRDKGDPNMFYIDMLHRLCVDALLWPLVECPRFPEYLKGKLVSLQCI